MRVWVKPWRVFSSSQKKQKRIEELIQFMAPRKRESHYEQYQNNYDYQFKQLIDMLYNFSLVSILLGSVYVANRLYRH